MTDHLKIQMLATKLLLLGTKECAEMGLRPKDLVLAMKVAEITGIEALKDMRRAGI